MVSLGSREAGIENKGFFSSRVRKWLKMADFALSTFEPAQVLGNKRKSRLFRRLVFSGRNQLTNHEPAIFQQV